MRFKNILVAGVVVYVNVALFFTGYVFVANTVKEDYARAVNKTSHLKDDFKISWHRKTNLAAYESQQQEIIKQIAALNDRLPNNLNHVQLQEYVSKTAERNHVTITEFGEVTEFNIEFYSALHWRMLMNGRYQDMVRFLYELQTDNGLIVNNLSFHMEVRPDNQVQLDGEFNGYHYITYPAAEDIYQKVKNEYDAVQ